MAENANIWNNILSNSTLTFFVCCLIIALFLTGIAFLFGDEEWHSIVGGILVTLCMGFVYGGIIFSKATCPGCGSNVQTEYCSDCGTRIRMYITTCDECGEDIDTDDIYCGSCGAEIYNGREDFEK